MKKSEDIFFFTLIDFLLQTCFFGLVLYALTQQNQRIAKANEKAEHDRIEKALAGAGVSTITELTDELTRLAPVKELRAMADVTRQAGGVEEVKKLQALAAQEGGADKLAAAVTEAKQTAALLQQVGGVDKVRTGLEKLRRYEEGSGKPPCLYDMVGDRKKARSVAVVVAGDQTITFQQTSPELDQLLGKIGKTYAEVRELSLSEFTRTFSSLGQKVPECRYTLRFLENTSLVHARDAARFAFYLDIGKP